MKNLPPFMLPIAAGIYLVAGLGSNSLLALAAIGALLIGCALLWRDGESPILLYVFCFQWLQASLNVFKANLQGVNVGELGQLASTSSDTELAVTLSLIGLAFLAVGIRFGIGPQSGVSRELVTASIHRHPPRIWFQVYAAAWLIATAAQSLALLAPGVSQPLLALANLKWAFFTIFTVVAFSRPDAGKSLWLAAFGLELGTSLGGYFSSFRSVFLFTFIGFAVARVRLSAAQLFFGVSLSAAMLTLGMVWTAVKPSYRAYISGGQAVQIVTVGYGERIAKLVELTSELDGDRLAEAAGRLADRIGHADIFSAVLSYVPSVTPHENGALWLDAITRPFMPRLFFPDKAIIDESTLTRRYTGLQVADMSQGTQISIGYMAESYVDFGEFGMMAAVFLLGYLLGRVYRWITSHENARGLLGFGLGSAIIMSAESLGMSATKIAGSLLVSLLVVWVLLRSVVPWFWSRT